jgi:hypothetical protein
LGKTGPLVHDGSADWTGTDAVVAGLAAGVEDTGEDQQAVVVGIEAGVGGRSGVRVIAVEVSYSVLAAGASR